MWRSESTVIWLKPGWCDLAGLLFALLHEQR
jgi:hypothetical protein